jgi:hypothetical protein
MPRNDAIGSKPPDRSDWNSAWDVVSRLAAARKSALQAGTGPQDTARTPVEHDGTSDKSAAAAPRIATAEPDQVARAVAEIEKASAALRRAEPGLEVGLPATPPRSRAHWSVWALIIGLWLSATVVVAGATGAILYFFG